MRVKCIKIINAATKVPMNYSSWLKIGKAYDVLEIYFDKSECYIRIEGDDNSTPIVEPLSCFELVSKRLPSNWIFNIKEDGSIQLRPNSWSVQGFWEKFFEKDLDALHAYDVERAIIMSSE